MSALDLDGRGVGAGAEHEVGLEARVRVAAAATLAGTSSARAARRAASSSAEPPIAVERLANVPTAHRRVVEAQLDVVAARPRARRRRSARTSSRGPGRAGRRRCGRSPARRRSSTRARPRTARPRARRRARAPIRSARPVLGLDELDARGPCSARSRRSHRSSRAGSGAGTSARGCGGAARSGRSATGAPPGRRSARGTPPPPGARRRGTARPGTLVGARADHGHAARRRSCNSRTSASLHVCGGIALLANRYAPMSARISRAHGEHPAVRVERELDVGLQPAPLVGGEEVLVAGLDPFDRAVQAQRRGDHRDDLRPRRALGAERAADVGQDARAASSPSACLNAALRRCDVLRGDPHVEPVGAARRAARSARPPCAGSRATRARRERRARTLRRRRRDDCSKRSISSGSAMAQLLVVDLDQRRRVDRGGAPTRRAPARRAGRRSGPRRSRIGWAASATWTPGGAWTGSVAGDARVMDAGA